MAAPAGYVPLDLVGFTDKGAYASENTYAANDIVHDDNKMYRSLQDNNTGHALPVTPETETEWWELWLSGGAEDLEAITVKDTSNVTGGGAGKVVIAQTLINAIANKVMNDLVAKSMIDNNLLGTDATHVLASPQGKALDEKITQLNSKFPEDKSYISAVIPRVKDITSGADQPNLRSDVAFMIQTKGIKSGEYGFSSTQYTDLPASAPKWGYVKYFQHADNYVTVWVFPDGFTGGILLNQFILGQNQWNTTWKKLELSETS